jgi:hypothetical protein
VPNLPAQTARLRLRFGSQGREVECEPSSPFAITSDRNASLADVSWRDGEQWLDVPTPSGWIPPTSAGPAADQRSGWILEQVAGWAGETDAKVPLPELSADRPHGCAPHPDNGPFAWMTLGRAPAAFPLRP